MRADGEASWRSPSHHLGVRERQEGKTLPIIGLASYALRTGSAWTRRTCHQDKASSPSQSSATHRHQSVVEGDTTLGWIRMDGSGV